MRAGQTLRTASIVGSAIAGIAAVAIVAGQTGGGYDLSWNAITGGGGRSTGGGYDLRGAVIAVDGSSSGGSYALQGGFFGGEPTKFKRFHPEIARDGIP